MRQPSANPVADAKVEVRLTASASDDGLETESLWAKSLGDNHFEICSVPAFAYNLNLGDVVLCEQPAGELPQVVGVVRRSGKQTLRLRFASSAGPELSARVLRELRSRGAVVEPFGAGSFGLAIPSFVALGAACQYICAEDPEEHIPYEPGFHQDEPFFDTTLPLDQGNA